MGVVLNLQLVLEFYAAFGRGDIAGALNKLTDDVVWLIPGPKDSRCLGNLRPDCT
jgi:ketosteroid isomerase-like protein